MPDHCSCVRTAADPVGGRRRQLIEGGLDAVELVRKIAAKYMRVVRNPIAQGPQTIQLFVEFWPSRTGPERPVERLAPQRLILVASDQPNPEAE